jgi:hypothetical protein
LIGLGLLILKDFRRGPYFRPDAGLKAGATALTTR